ncbi:MAG: hypothetical protein A3B47_02110 [Candidatus Levybacteria bacterium RIFCSPLOWO2_01_FULL_39_24]|nr:MAG: hypothetical protein A2800_01405 [Candidatus Levybacteria bacterium RIFCSPHIGHO2_01_FULL_40_16]OGH28673.1 MAG: hypothetical protein A3E12_00060 [Candidatus Levybacteria bacterium RIFCSPHIGHO2_12_FULL_39_9]OGH46435.1 MAG: hypothetical protein A3B47_02110 [Candidatus Levybacteria bacterium RIFCSPLOWO2_01_FULL_39_24]
MIHNTKYNLVIGWLYPELMSTYGDRGNIIVLQKRCEWRGIKVEIKLLDLEFKINELKMCDLIFMGGAQDQQQKIVAYDLLKKREALKEMIEDGIPGLYICGAYQFLGKYYREADGKIIKGLNILDLYTENPGPDEPRLIGNIAISPCHPELVSGSHTKGDSDLRQNDNEQALVGFENHGGRTYLGKSVKPLGKVIKGYGNNGDLPAIPDGKSWQAGDETEGAVYKNSFGTYLHGPILPKNPQFTDLLIKIALEKKYNKNIVPNPLDDSLEKCAKKSILQKMKIK